MKRLVIARVVVSSLGLAGVACNGATAAAPEALELASDIHLSPDADLIRGTVPPRATLDGLLAGHDISGPERVAIVRALSGTFDLRRLRAGQPYQIDRLRDGGVRSLKYEIDGDRRIHVVRRKADTTRDPAAEGFPGATEGAFTAAIEPIAKTTTIVTVEGAISRDTPTLTGAIDAAGERIELALQFADVFSGEVDFTSDLQRGDTFRLVVERRSRQGVFAGYGAILAAELVNAGRSVRAVRFAPDGGAPGYYDEHGRSLKRFFLKSPLKFEPRVTSRFSSARRHPILDYTRAHNGVDYRAPSGAPVASVAPGVVTLAGWTEGGGRTVRVRHTNGYESEYLHLSSIAVRAGARVAQGDLVGRVGASGLATGPHLHYGLRKHGSYVNPVREFRAMPPGDPVPAAQLATFAIERDRILGLLTTPSLRNAND